MKTYLLLAVCLVFVGCNQQEQSNREVLAKLESLKSELTAKRADTGPRAESLRWAFANKQEIQMAIFQKSRDKMEESKKAEALPAETEAKISEYEALKLELIRMGIPPPALSRAFGGSRPDATPANEAYEALSKKVAEAKAPIAAVVDRREQLAAQFRSQYAIDKLIAEYAKDRFELVVDSSEERYSRSAILYRTASEAVDITDGVLKLFQEKTKP